MDMKEPENKKSTWAICLSIAAILLCLLVFALWAFEVMPRSVVAAESFIGVCVALLAVIVTVAVGAQIVNVMEVKSAQKKYEEEQLKVEKLQKQLEEKLCQFEQNTENDKHHSMHLHGIMLAMQSSILGKHDEACYHCFEALAESLQMQDPMNVEDILRMIRTNLNLLKKSTDLSSDDITDLKAIDKIILTSVHYRWIHTKYSPLRDEYFKKIGLE